MVFAGSLGLSCVRGANLEETLGEDSPLAISMPATSSLSIAKPPECPPYAKISGKPRVPGESLFFATGVFFRKFCDIWLAPEHRVGDPASDRQLKLERSRCACRKSKNE
jgi:hypothetical protein